MTTPQKAAEEMADRISLQYVAVPSRQDDLRQLLREMLPPALLQFAQEQESESFVYPVIMGKPITREEIVEGLRAGYDASVAIAQQDDPATVGFPDMQTILDHIDEHGLPSKSAVKQESEEV